MQSVYGCIISLLNLFGGYVSACNHIYAITYWSLWVLLLATQLLCYALSVIIISVRIHLANVWIIEHIYERLINRETILLLCASLYISVTLTHTHIHAHTLIVFVTSRIHVRAARCHTFAALGFLFAPLLGFLACANVSLLEARYGTHSI